jgi:hypothetical protein
MRKWRDLRLSTKLPKYHLFEHWLEQIVKYRGIGDFAEDFIEQAHQFGMKDEKRTANMRDRVRTAISHSKWEYAQVLSAPVQL